MVWRKDLLEYIKLIMSEEASGADEEEVRGTDEDGTCRRQLIGVKVSCRLGGLSSSTKSPLQHSRPQDSCMTLTFRDSTADRVFEIR